MPLVAPVYIVDASGNQWQISVGNGGVPIISTPTSGQQAQPYVNLNDVGQPNTTWQFTIVPNPSPYPLAQPGDIYITQIPYQPMASRYITVNSPDGNVWWIEVLNGDLATIPGTALCYPAVGSLYIQNYNGIAWSQPGGIGTTVYPQQNTGSFGYPGNQILMQEPGQGLWTAGCGHWYDCLQVFKDIDVCTNQNIALFCCPLCSYIIRAVEPFDSIYDPVSSYILIP